MVLSKRKCLLCGVEKKPLFVFPKDYQRLMLWLRIIGKASLLEDSIYTKEYIKNNGRLCSSHFEDSAFSSTLKTRLIRFAQPKSEVSFFGNNSLLTSVSSEVSSPKMSELPEGVDMETKLNDPVLHSSPQSAAKYTTRVISTPKTKKIQELQAKNRALEKKLRTFSEQMDGLEQLKKLLTTTQYEFILSQLKVVRLKGSCWSPKDKSVALNIYLQSPAAYGILRKYFAFPNKSILKQATGTK